MAFRFSRCCLRFSSPASLFGVLQGATKRIAGFEAFPHMGLKKSPNDQIEAAKRKSQVENINDMMVWHLAPLLCMVSASQRSPIRVAPLLHHYISLHLPTLLPTIPSPKPKVPKGLIMSPKRSWNAAATFWDLNHN
jgi:hypothetical protein